jgi:hypothetical protein
MIVRRYVPVLKALQGERQALEVLDPALRNRVTPLLEIHPPRWKKIAGKARPQTLEEVLNKVGPKLAQALGHGQAFIDGLYLAPAQRMASGIHPLTHIMEEARRAEVSLVPVTSPERGEAYQAAVREAVRADNRGVCIRLRRTELFADDSEPKLEGLLTALGTTPSAADLILDVEQVQRDDINMLSRSIIGVLATLAHVNEWRSLTLTSGAFPESVSHITVMDAVPRSDWLLWQAITSKGKALARLPSYGDYSIQCTQPATPEETMHMGSANIRYTADDHWLVVRGRGLRQYGFEQYHELARVLTRQHCYMGRTFSWGDNFIFDCAGEVETSGNQTTWRKVGTSHHMAMVLKQLTNPRVP